MIDRPGIERSNCAAELGRHSVVETKVFIDSAHSGTTQASSSAVVSILIDSNNRQ